MTFPRPTASTPAPSRVTQPGVAATAASTAAPSPIFRITHPAIGGTGQYLNLLVYGEYGSGKTVLAGTADDVPEMKNVLYIDAEAGKTALTDRPNLDVVTINTFKQLARVYEFLRLHCRLRDDGSPEALRRMAEIEMQLKGLEAPPEKPTIYRTVVVDSLTEVQTYLMYQLMGVDPNKVALDAELTSPEWGEWRQSSDTIQLLARQFRDLPMNVIMVLSEQEVQESGTRMVRRINLPGKLASRIQGFWDMVGYLQKAVIPGDQGTTVTRWRLYLTKGQNFQAKHRFRRIDVDFVEDPTIGKLLGLAKQEWAAETAERTSNTNASASPATPPQPSPATAAAPAAVPGRAAAAGSAGPGSGRAVVRPGAVRTGRPIGRG